MRHFIGTACVAVIQAVALFLVLSFSSFAADYPKRVVVKKGESLWHVAKRVKIAEQEVPTVYQWMAVLFEKNTNAFLHDDMHRIVLGAELLVPDEAVARLWDREAAFQFAKKQPNASSVKQVDVKLLTDKESQSVIGESSFDLLVAEGDTLRSIAQALMPNGQVFELEQVMVAIFESNLSSFENDLMSQLKVDSRIVVPNLIDVGRVEVALAQEKVRKHYAQNVVKKNRVVIQPTMRHVDVPVVARVPDGVRLSEKKQERAFSNDVEQEREVVLAESSESDNTQQSVAQNDVAGSPMDSTGDMYVAQLFTRAFGTKVPKTFHPYDMTIVLDGWARERMSVGINPYTDDVRFHRETLKTFFESHLLTAEVAPLFATNSKFISEHLLRTFGVRVQLNIDRGWIALTTPLNMRDTVDILLSRAGAIDPDSPYQPADVSGYMNVRQQWQRSESNDEQLQTDFEANLNVKNWVAQTEFGYDELDEDSWTVKGGRLMRDDVKRRTRYTLGSNESPNAQLKLERRPIASAFEKELVGFDATSTRYFDASRGFRDDFEYFISLEQTARVQIELNGRDIYDELLPLGKYRLRQFPLDDGDNVIIVRKIVEGLPVWEKRIEQFYSARLLKAGDREFKFAVGVPYEKSATDITRLDENVQTAIGFWRYGFTKQFTGGVYGQFVRDNTLVGGIGEYGIGEHIMTLESAFSGTSGEDDGHAVRFRAYRQQRRDAYSYTLIPTRYDVSVDYRSRYFNDSGEYANGVLRYDVRPSLYWQFSSCCQMSASYFWRERYDEDDPSTLTRFSLFSRWPRWQANVDVEREDGTSFNDGWRSLLRLTYWMDKGRRNRIDHWYNDESNEHRTLVNYWPGQGVNTNLEFENQYVSSNQNSQAASVRYNDFQRSFTAKVSNRRIDSTRDQQLGMTYQGGRGLLNYTLDERDSGADAQSMSVSTALAFVGKRWAVTRPIDESFVLFYPNSDDVRSGRVLFDGGARIDQFGSAVYGRMNSYDNNKVTVRQTDLPLGTALPERLFNVSTGLNSGVAIPIGKPGGSVLVKGRLVDENNQPVKLESGLMTFVNDASVQQQFFTNKDGTFIVMGLRYGAYRLTLFSDAYQLVEFNVPKGAKSPFTLQDIVVRFNIEQPGE